MLITNNISPVFRCLSVKQSRAILAYKKHLLKGGHLEKLNQYA